MNFRKYLENVRDYDGDDVLNMMGLQRRTSGDWVFPMLAGIGAGMAIGAGLAFFLTPYKGDEAREKFARSAGDAQRFLGERVNQLSDKVTQLASQMGIAAEGDNKVAQSGIGTGTGAVTTNRTMGVGSSGTGVSAGGIGGGTGSGVTPTGIGGNGNRSY